MKKRLLLVSPLGDRSLLGSDFYFRLPSLGLLKLASLTPPDWEVAIVDEKVETLNISRDADLVGITAMTPVAKRAYSIADSFRSRGIPVVMGGMHVSKLPEEALQHCDSVVAGEAEDLWDVLLADLERGQMKPIYRHECGYPCLDRRPLPDWDLYRDKGYLPVHFIETTRGCPFNCEFCSVTSSFGGKFRNRPVDDVEEEIRAMKPFPGRFTWQNLVFFNDDNIISSRSHARELLTRMIPYRLDWLGQTSVDMAQDDEMLALCRKSGCMGLLVGFESLSAETLKSVNKGVNKPRQYLDVVKRMHDHGIGVKGSFIFGFDTDDEGVFERTVEFAQKAKIDVVYYSILTPYPGTALYRQMAAEGRIIDHDWNHYNTHNVVFRPKHMTPERLLDGYWSALKESFSYSSIFRRMWGNGTRYNFFFPMNFGYRQSIAKAATSAHV
ncbi:MAG: radical SAM protein [Geobacteraceae bacterium]|nr:radical SAM protein [Geobacteraceae bacterium]